MYAEAEVAVRDFAFTFTKRLKNPRISLHRTRLKPEFPGRNVHPKKTQTVRDLERSAYVQIALFPWKFNSF